MKKLILLLMLFVLPLKAQIVDGANVSSTNPQPVYTPSGFGIMQQPDTAVIWASDTLAVAGKIDTLSKFAYYTLTTLNTMFSTRYQLTITADSTILVSTSGSFTSGLTFTVKTGESWTTGYMSPAKYTMLYVKMGSAITGVTTWRADIHGY